MAQIDKSIDQYQGEIRCVLDGLIEEMKNPSTSDVQLHKINIFGTAINLTIAGKFQMNIFRYVMHFVLKSAFAAFQIGVEN